MTETTAIRLTFANLQGAEAWLPNPGYYGLHTLQINNMIAEQPSSNPGLSFDKGYPVDETWHTNGGSGQVYHDAGTTSLFGMYDYHYIWANFDVWSLWGCDGADPADAGAVANDPWMCGGYIEWTFPLEGRFELTDASSVTMTFSDAATYSAFQCTTGADCATATPEPITMLLFGTGLAGIGLVRRRRRKLTDDIT